MKIAPIEAKRASGPRVLTHRKSSGIVVFQAWCRSEIVRPHILLIGRVIIKNSLRLSSPNVHHRRHIPRFLLLHGGNLILQILDIVHYIHLFDFVQFQLHQIIRMLFSLLFLGLLIGLLVANSHITFVTVGILAQESRPRELGVFDRSLGGAFITYLFFERRNLLLCLRPLNNCRSYETISHSSLVVEWLLLFLGQHLSGYRELNLVFFMGRTLRT